MAQVEERSAVKESDKWNVEALYPNLDTWQKDFERVCNPSKKPHWPELSGFKGRLGEGPEVVFEAISKMLDVERNLSMLYTYAHMRHDEDLTNEDFKKAHALIGTLHHEFGKEVSYFEPEILSLDDEMLNQYLKEPALEPYHFYLERVIRQKPHTLSADKEELLAMVGKPLGTSGMAFSAFNNADLDFPKILDGEGNEHELTHGSFSSHLRSHDRTLRQNAFEAMHGSFSKFENTVCELLSGHVHRHVFSTRARHYDSCLEAALFPNAIDPTVYTNLIETVRSQLSVLHKYIELRKKVLGVDSLHMFDLYVPLVEEVDLTFTYDQAEEMVAQSVAPLGQPYQEILYRGLKSQRWVDRYENKNKRSGAYSTGCYDSMPYILMNYHGNIRDLMTLAHEAGHSMHSHLSHKNQPYQYSHYPIFLAEVASTFNEELMFHHLKGQNLTDQEKIYLINQKLEDIRATLFRQTMFAEFELMIHTLAEQDVPLTPGLLKEKYHQLNVDYFGPHIEVDPLIDIEWARIPHFYSNFYVYQYATGISSAHALFEKVMSGGNSARDAYLNFLSSGSRNYPLDLLEEAGVNMRQKGPIEATIRLFDELVTELSNLIT